MSVGTLGVLKSRESQASQTLGSGLKALVFVGRLKLKWGAWLVQVVMHLIKINVVEAKGLPKMDVGTTGDERTVQRHPNATSNDLDSQPRTTWPLTTI